MGKLSSQEFLPTPGLLVIWIKKLAKHVANSPPPGNPQHIFLSSIVSYSNEFKMPPNPNHDLNLKPHPMSTPDHQPL